MHEFIVHRVLRTVFMIGRVMATGFTGDRRCFADKYPAQAYSANDRRGRVF
jgi:hypothetical protein